MLCKVNWENAHLFGDALPALHKLRHRVFVERQNWDVPVFKNMEYDQFDTPAAEYLVWFDQDRIPRGVTRLIPTTEPYMIKALWADHLPSRPPSSETVWEASRIGVEKFASPPLRRQALGALIYGALKVGLSRRIETYLCVMSPRIIKTLLVRCGCDVKTWTPWTIDGQEVVVGEISVTRDALERVREAYGIPHLSINNSSPGGMRNWMKAAS